MGSFRPGRLERYNLQRMKDSEQVVPLPGVIKGDRALAKFSKDVKTSIQALRDRGGSQEFRQTFASPYCPLTPHFLRKVGSQWKVQWRPGYVYQIHASAAGPIQEYEIYIGSTSLAAATAPDLDISLGDYVYLHFETTDDGQIKEISAGISAEIVALGSEQDSTYHVLPDGNGSAGTAGNYYLLLAQVNTVDGLASISKNGWRGNFFWHSGWDALENVGSGEKIYKDYDVATDRKRLRSLVERASSPQINLSTVGTDEIRVEGNNKDAYLRFQDCDGAELYTLNWADGLHTNAANGTITVPGCSSGSDTYVTSASFGTSTGILTLTRNDAATVTVDLDGKYQNELSTLSGNCGVGVTAPGSKLSVNGNMAIGSSYATSSAPSNGCIIQGMVGIGTTGVSGYYQLEVNGGFSASSKSFVINHPNRKNKKLAHGCLEGPEHAVYYRGKTTSGKIKAPEYWTGLVDISTMSVELTSYGQNQGLYVDSITEKGEITVKSENGAALNYFFTVYGTRKDLDPLEVVIDPVKKPVPKDPANE